MEMEMEITKLTEGFKMRPVQMNDLEAVVGLVNEYSRLLNAQDESTLSDVENFWKTPGLSIQDDLRIVFSPQGKAVGYIEALALANPPVHPFVWLRVHPEAVDSGAGEALLDWALRRLDRVLEIVPKDLRVSISTFILNSYKPLQHLLESRGFRLIRHAFDMGIDLDEAPTAAVWPEGIVLRPFDPEEHAEAVYRAMDEAFTDHFGHVAQPFEQGFPRWRHLMLEDKESFDPELWFVAVDGDQIAGASICRLAPRDGGKIGWVEDLAVRRPWRKRGLGMTLLLHSFAEFRRRGLGKAGLSVDASNLTGALKLYERAGMVVRNQYDRYEKELRPGKELMTTEVSE